MKKYRLELILFLSGAVVMILELVGSRIVAPFLGTSIYVWTSLIGIILGSLSLGYWWGGRMADRHPHGKPFSRLLLAASLLIGMVYLVRQPVLSGIQESFTDIRLATVAAASILFAPASILLGAVTPYAVRLKINHVGSAGKVAGRLYAVSTVGSIVGTFSAGFFLIAFFGSGDILLFLSGTLLFAYFLAADPRGRLLPLVLAGLFLIAAGLFARTPNRYSDPVSIDMDTRYNRIIIEERRETETGSHIRYLRIDQKWAQSAVNVNDPHDLVFDYNKFYRLAEHFVPERSRALLIGGGAGTFARDYLRRNPGSLMDVVEIDPDFTQLAARYFFLSEDPRLSIYHEDGRTFLRRVEKAYDVIFVDVFKASASPPFHLMTREAALSMASRLKKGGALLTNVFSAVEGNNGRFLRAAVATLKSVFPTVLVFPVQSPHADQAVQNVILVALNSQKAPSLTTTDGEMQRYLTHRRIPPVTSDMPILTDDQAPVEYLALGAIRTFASRMAD